MSNILQYPTQGPFAVYDSKACQFLAVCIDTVGEARHLIETHLDPATHEIIRHGSPRYHQLKTRRSYHATH